MERWWGGGAFIRIGKEFVSKVEELSGEASSNFYLVSKESGFSSVY